MGGADRIIHYGFLTLLLSLCLAACAATPSPLEKPYGGLPEQFLGYWKSSDPRYCLALDVDAKGKMNSVCETDGKIMETSKYRFDCSPDPRTAFVTVEYPDSSGYTPYYKLVIDDQYKSYGNVYLKLYTAAYIETLDKHKRCNKDIEGWSGPGDNYMRKTSEVSPLPTP